LFTSEDNSHHKPRLSEGKGSQSFSAGELGQVLLLLLLVSSKQDPLEANRLVSTEVDPHSEVALPHNLHQHNKLPLKAEKGRRGEGEREGKEADLDHASVASVCQTNATKVGRHHEPKQPQLLHLLGNFGRHRGSLVVLLGVIAL